MGYQSPQPPIWYHMSPFTHPMVTSVVSITLLSITFLLRPDEATLFWLGESLSVLINNFYSIQFTRGWLFITKIILFSPSCNLSHNLSCKLSVNGLEMEQVES